MNRCAIFMDADPLTIKEVQAVKQVIKIYGHADIFLERKAFSRKSKLSYDEKVDIIKHELKNANYFVHPIDKSKCDSLQENEINNVAIPTSSLSDFQKIHDQAQMYFQLIPNCSTIFLPVKSELDVTPEYIWQLVLDDVHKLQIKNYLSDYAYFKIKTKLVKKIFIERPKTCTDSIKNLFMERGDKFEYLNVDTMDVQQQSKAIANIIMNTPKKCLAICGEQMPREMAKLFDACITTSSENAPTAAQEVVKMLNTKLKKLGCETFM